MPSFSEIMGYFITGCICAYIIYLIWVRGVEKGNIYSILALIGIITMILLNIMRFVGTKDYKYLWKILFYLLMTVFIVLIYLDMELTKDCLSDDQKNSFLVHTLMLFSVYLYLYKERSLADCSYLSFSKILMILSIILCFIHDMGEALVICLFLLFYMNS